MAMNKQPLVSVIIPCHNCEQYIIEAIESVLNQSYQYIETIVVDDGSTDQSKDKIAPYVQSGKIIYLYQSNQGVSAARNAGFKASKGDYIKFLDSDDFLFPLQIEKQIADLQTHASGLSLSRYKVLLPSGRLINKDVYICEPKLQYAMFIEGCQGGGLHSFLLRRELVTEVGGFDENLSDCADLDFWIRILRNGHYISTIDDYGCCYRVLDNSMSSQTKRLFMDKCRVYEKVNTVFLNQKDMPPKHLMDKLLIINPRLIYECQARNLNLDKHLPQTMRMTRRIYQSRKLGWRNTLFNAIGVKGYSRLQYWAKNIQDPPYKEQLLNQEISWKFEE